MSTPYRLFGAEMSPYSVKVRAYLRYKNLPHQWLVRNENNQAAYDQHAKIAIVPLLVDDEGNSQQDSTPIIETLEAEHPDHSIYPQNSGLKFISQLLEEFADEWANKWMFHYRWARDVDQLASSKRLALMMKPSADEAEQNGIAEFIKERMTGRVWFVGSNSQTAPLIEDSFHQAIEQLDHHLATRPYLLGGRPSFADFALWGQLYCCWTDPTAGTLIESRAQYLMAWIQRMLFPRDEGDYESWQQLAPSLAPFMKAHMAKAFVPWTLANARAIEQGQEAFEVSLEIAQQPAQWQQKPQKYHAKSLQVLREKYQALADSDELDAILTQLGMPATDWLL